MWRNWIGEWPRPAALAGVVLAACALGATTKAAAIDAAPADFTAKDAVLSSIDRMARSCAEAGAAACKTNCETAHRLAGSHLSQTKVRPLAVENSWKSCQQAYAAAQAPAPAAIDYANFPINGFTLHADLAGQRARFEMLEARGFVAAAKGEATVRLIFKGKPEAGARAPEPVLHYNGIVEQGGFTQIEATGDGRVFRIRQVVKGAVDPAKAKADIIARFGPPQKTQGDMLMWGCSKNNHEGCVIAEIMPHQVEYRAVDDSIKPDWGRKYEEALRKARQS